MLDIRVLYRFSLELCQLFTAALAVADQCKYSKHVRAKQLKLTKLPSAGLVAALVEVPAPHIWREKTSGMPVCFTRESKKGSTDGSG